MSLADDLLAVLEDPTHMWSHALRESSRDSQRLFLTLPLLPQPIAVDDLQVAHSGQVTTPAESFLDSLRALEDSFLQIGVEFQGARWVDFRNPSLQDFSHQYLSEYSDWLDTLLSAPVYYEQIVNAYKLGMARDLDQTILTRGESGPPTRTVREGERKFDGIHRWLTRRHAQLIPKALDLASTGSQIHLHYMYESQDACSKLKELLQILLAYGIPPGDSVRQALSKVIQQALKPATKDSASIMFDLLRASQTADIIAVHAPSDAMKILRHNLLDKDKWKFAMLARIDELLGVGPDDSMTAWGRDYIAHAEGLEYQLSGNEDPDDYDEAIEELRDVSSFLGIDLYDQIDILETKRDELPQRRSDEDFESYDAASSKSNSQDPSRELDRIFSALLE
jgi:hypothetical protein